MEKATTLIKALPSSKAPCGPCGPCAVCVEVCNSLSAASAAASAVEEGKCWAVLSLGKSSLAEVHTALQQGSGQLGVVLVASVSPVSQLEVLRAMEDGGVYVACAELDKVGDCLREVASYSAGPSLVLLAEAAALKGDEHWTAFRYDPRREDAGASRALVDT